MLVLLVVALAVLKAVLLLKRSLRGFWCWWFVILAPAVINNKRVKVSWFVKNMTPQECYIGHHLNNSVDLRTFSLVIRKNPQPPSDAHH